MCCPSPGTRRPKWMSASTATPASQKEPLAEFFRVGAAGHLARLGDVGPGVERSAGRAAFDSRDLVEQSDDQIAPLEKRRGALLRPPLAAR